MLQDDINFHVKNACTYVNGEVKRKLFVGSMFGTVLGFQTGYQYLQCVLTNRLDELTAEVL